MCLVGGRYRSKYLLFVNSSNSPDNSVRIVLLSFECFSEQGRKSLSASRLSAPLLVVSGVGLSVRSVVGSTGDHSTLLAGSWPQQLCQ